MSASEQVTDRAAPPLSVQPDFLDAASAQRWLRWCGRRLPWKQDRVRMFGREYACKRLVAFVAESGLRYRYSGSEHRGCGLPRPLVLLLARVNGVLGTAFDSILLTRYRDGEDRLGWHADREPELGADPELAVVSLGVPRTLAFRSSQASMAPRRALRYRLESGSLLYMGPGTQSQWQHCVPAERCQGERISLSFRRLRSP